MQVKEKAEKSKARRHTGEMQIKDVARGAKRRLKLRIITAVLPPMTSCPPSSESTVVDILLLLVRMTAWQRRLQT